MSLTAAQIQGDKDFKWVVLIGGGIIAILTVYSTLQQIKLNKFMLKEYDSGKALVKKVP